MPLETSIGRLALAGLVATTALMATAQVYADEEKTLWRLFVADQAEPIVTVLDLDSDARWQFQVNGPAKLYPTPSGHAVVAVQSDHDTVSFFKSGIDLEQHGDHGDIAVTDPAQVDAILEGPRPFHVVTHHDTVAINFDKGGYVTFHDETDLVEGSIKGDTFSQNRAHHGFAVPMGDLVVSSVASSAPTEGDAAPPRVGIQPYTKDGKSIGEMQPCTDLHGEAFSGRYLLAGCKEGVVAVEEGPSPRFTMLPYPEDFPEEHTGTLLGARGIQMFLGNYGAQAVVIIDPTTAPYFELVELPFRRVDFVLDPIRPQHAFILTEDGTLHRLNMLRAEIEASARVTEPYSMDGHWRDPRPRLAMADDQVVVTDPRQSLVRVVSAATLAEETTVPVEGLPYNIIAIGGAGLTH
jgi:hypothetical protein